MIASHTGAEAAFAYTGRPHDYFLAMWVAGDGSDWAWLDLEAGRLLEGDAALDAGGLRPAGLPAGWYRYLSGVPVVFFGAHDGVWLQIGAALSQCRGPNSVDWVRQANGMARLSLIDSDVVAASVVYFAGDVSGVPPETDFSWVTSEDFDFGEFVRKKLDDEDNLRRIFGAGISYDATASLSVTAKTYLAALPVPAASGDLGPLVRPAGALDESVRAGFEQFAAFVSSLDDAPTGPSQGRPPVMPIVLALTDREREVLRTFSVLATERARERGSAELLELAAVAAVLGGLDCALESPSFEAARSATVLLARATAERGIDPSRIVDRVGRRVGPVGKWRLERLLMQPSADVN